MLNQFQRVKRNGPMEKNVWTLVLGWLVGWLVGADAIFEIKVLQLSGLFNVIMVAKEVAVIVAATCWLTDALSKSNKNAGLHRAVMSLCKSNDVIEPQFSSTLPIIWCIHRFHFHFPPTSANQKRITRLGPFNINRILFSHGFKFQTEQIRRQSLI